MLAFVVIREMMVVSPADLPSGRLYPVQHAKKALLEKHIGGRSAVLLLLIAYGVP